MVYILVILTSLLSIPILNENVFGVKNLSEVRREAKAKFKKIEELNSIGAKMESRDSLNSLIDYFESNKDNVSSTVAQLGRFSLATQLRSEYSAASYKRAIEEYKLIIKKYPKTTMAERVFFFVSKTYIDLAKMQKRDDYYLKAIESLEKIEKNRPESQNFPKYKSADLKPGTYFNMDKGRIKKKNANLDKKIYTNKVMLKEIEDGKSQVKAELLSDAIILIGDCFTEIGEGDKARDQYKIIINNFSESDLVDDAQKKVGDSYVKEADKLLLGIDTLDESSRIEKQKEAEKLYESAVAVYLKFINVYIQSSLISTVYIDLGGTYFSLNKPDEAKATFSKAINSIKVIEKQAKIQLEIGNYYSSVDKLEDAIDNYGKVLINFPNTKYAANAQFLIGDCFDRNGDTLSAIKAYQEVTESYRASPLYPVAAFKMGQYYFDKKDYPRSLTVLRASISRDRESSVAAQTQYLIGNIFKTQADLVDSAKGILKYKQAIKEFQVVIDYYDMSQERDKAVIALGECRMELGQNKMARDVLNTIRNPAYIAQKMKILAQHGVTDETILTDYYEELEKIEEPQARANMLLNIGRLLSGKELGLVDSAIIVLSDAMELATEDFTKIVLWGALADCNLQKKLFQRARDIYATEILSNPKCTEAMSVQYQFKIAQSYMSEQKYTEAVEKLTVFTEKFPSHKSLSAPAVYLLGKSLHKLKDYKKAREYYQRVMTEYDSSSMVDDAALDYAVSLADDSMAQKAIDYMDKFLKNNPGVDALPNFYYQYGDIYTKKLSKKDLGLANYIKVIENFPDNSLFSGAAFYAAQILASYKKDKEAIEMYSKVKKEDLVFFRASRGEIGSIKSKTDPLGAIKDYEDIESTSDDVADKVIARMGIGDIYSAQKKYKKAFESYVTIYEKYSECDPNMKAAALVKLIDALNNRGKYKTLIKWANRMIAEFPDNKFTVNAVYFKANAFYSLSQYYKARKVFKEVMNQKVNPDLAKVAQYQRAECLLSLEKKVKAIREFRIFTKMHPKNSLVANSIFQIANIQFGDEEFSKAKRNYLNIKNNHPKFVAMCWVYNYLGYCYNKENEWKRALSYYNKVIRRACDKGAKEYATKEIKTIKVTH